MVEVGACSGKVETSGVAWQDGRGWSVAIFWFEFLAADARQLFLVRRELLEDSICSRGCGGRWAFARCRYDGMVISGSPRLLEEG